MNKNKLVFLFVSVTLLLTLVVVSVGTNALIKETYVINNNDTKESLEELKASLIDKDIDLKLIETKFDQEGLLKSIKGEVSTTFTSGKFSSDNISKVVIKKSILGVKIQVKSNTK